MLKNRTTAHYVRSLIEASLDPLVTISADGKIMDVNTATEKVTGVPRDKLIGSDFSDYFTDPEMARAGYQHVFAQGHVTDYPLAIRHTSGKIIDVLYNAAVYRDEHGKVAGIFAAARDITTLKQSQQELEDTNREILTLRQMTDLLQSCQIEGEAYPIIKASMSELFPNTSGGFYIIKESGNLLEQVTDWGVSPPQETVFAPGDCWALRRGHSHLVAPGQHLSPRCNHAQHETAPYMCVPLMAQGKALGIVYLSMQDSDASNDAQLHRKQRLAEMTTDSIGLALANLKLRETLRSLSIRDPLTGLFNRRFMEETLERELSRMARSEKPLIVAMMDIDNFKLFNDTYGHDAGDALLKEYASLMLSFRRGSDVACRYGGEEFILILPEITPDQALARLEQLRQSVGQISLNFHDQSLPHVTASMGVAVYPQHGTSGLALIKSADTALYQAKHAGRNCIVTASQAPP
jgi:diguanylate cyclase (GGDEF)-like protein/PAS domain S-box-containing protein